MDTGLCNPAVTGAGRGADRWRSLASRSSQLVSAELSEKSSLKRSYLRPPCVLLYSPVHMCSHMSTQNTAQRVYGLVRDRAWSCFQTVHEDIWHRSGFVFRLRSSPIYIYVCVHAYVHIIKIFQSLLKNGNLILSLSLTRNMQG